MVPWRASTRRRPVQQVPRRRHGGSARRCGWLQISTRSELVRAFKRASRQSRAAVVPPLSRGECTAPPRGLNYANHPAARTRVSVFNFLRVTRDPAQPPRGWRLAGRVARHAAPRRRAPRAERLTSPHDGRGRAGAGPGLGRARREGVVLFLAPACQCYWHGHRGVRPGFGYRWRRLPLSVRGGGVCKAFNVDCEATPAARVSAHVAPRNAPRQRDGEGRHKTPIVALAL